MHSWQRQRAAAVVQPNQVTRIQLDGIVVAGWRVCDRLVIRRLLPGPTGGFLDGDHMDRIVDLLGESYGMNHARSTTDTSGLSHAILRVVYFQLKRRSGGG